MKINYTLASLLFVATFSLSSQTYGFTTHNKNIEKCYEATKQITVTPSLRTCNYVIKSRFSSRKNKAIALHNRGVIYLNHNLNDKALKSFEKAARTNSKQSASMLSIAQLHYANDNVLLALKYVEKVLSKETDNSVAHKLRQQISNDRPAGNLISKPLVAE